MNEDIRLGDRVRILRGPGKGKVGTVYGINHRLDNPIIVDCDREVFFVSEEEIEKVTKCTD